MNEVKTTKNPSAVPDVSTGINEINTSEAIQLFRVSEAVCLYAKCFDLPTELTFEFSKYPGSRRYHSTDKHRGWKLGAEGAKPNAEPNYREGVALLIGRGLQFFVFREPLDESVPLYKPEGFNISDLATDDPIVAENEVRKAAENQAMLNRLVHGRYTGYHAVLESMLDFADQHELVIPPIDQLVSVSDE